MKKYPEVIIDEKGAGFLKRGQQWMYRNNLIRNDEDVQDGEPADILTEEGEYLGTGFWSDCSHVAVRILSRTHEEINEEFLRRRIRAAVDYRRTTVRDNLTNCRLIFSEADGLPGVICDRFNEILVTQITISGMEKRKKIIYEALLDEFRDDPVPIAGIYERNDIASRIKEGLEQYKGPWNSASFPTETIISENGLKLVVDTENGQKTGYFLDQKSNRMLIRNIAAGKRVLDCFTHTGGFALNAALGGAVYTAAVDVSRQALSTAERNAALNGLSERMEFIQADVFEYLDEVKPGQFDLIILDPPAFTKSRRTVDHAYSGYRRINRKAMELQRGGRYLATCSCSRYMETPLFEQMLRESALEAGVTLKQISVTQQNSDHPILWTMDETSYLKFYIFQII